MSLRVQVNQIASRKISLHSLKYLTEDVFGIIIRQVYSHINLGVVVGTVNGNNIQITDAYPLFHSKFLTPTLETAFEFVNIYLKLFKRYKVEALANKKNQNIVGWYEGYVKNNDNATDTFTDITKEVVESMSKNTKFPLLLSVYLRRNLILKR